MTNILPQPDYDSRWKQLIKALPRWFVLRFFPALYLLVDWSKPVRFLDKELQKLLADFAKKGVRTGDLVMEFQMLAGGSQFVLVHAEAQHIYDAEVPERMFITFYRLRDQHPGTPLTAIALYTGENVPSSHDRYCYQFDQVELMYKFPALLVRDQKEEELLQSGNPLDLAILAGLYALQGKGDVQKAFAFKRKLARLCAERLLGDPLTFRILATFVSFLIALPEEEEAIYKQELTELLNIPAMSIREEMPIQARTVDTIWLGKPLEEWLQDRDRERDLQREREREKELEKSKKLAVKLHLAGIKPGTIADFMEASLEFVKTAIKEFETAQKKLEKNKQLILKLHLEGIKPEAVAQSLEVDLLFVKATIRDFKAAQKAASSNGGGNSAN